MQDSDDRAKSLVYAIAHEVGNHLGAIRLEAHLLDEDLGPRALAQASITIDAMAGRSGPLLALIRCLLSQAPPRASGETWPSLMRRLARHFEDEGTRAVALEWRIDDESALVGTAPDWAQSMLTAIVGSTLEHVSPRGAVTVVTRPVSGGCGIYIEDDGEAENLESDAAPRGRPLSVAIARELMGRGVGRVDASRIDGRTRVELVFEAPPPV